MPLLGNDNAMMFYKNNEVVSLYIGQELALFMGPRVRFIF